MADSAFIWPGSSGGGGAFTGQSIGPAADNTAAPPFTFLGDLDTGLGSSAANTVNLVTGGTSRLTLTSTAATFAASVIGSFTNSALATTSTDGLFLQNATAATGAATVQISPRFRLRGTAWDTAASQTVDFFMENLPATAATPTGTLKFGYSRNGGAASYPMTLSSAGLMILENTLSVGKGTAPSSNFVAEFVGNQDAQTSVGVTNSTAGAASYARLVANSDAQGLSLFAFSSAFTTSNQQVQGHQLVAGGSYLDLSSNGNNPVDVWSNGAKVASIGAATASLVMGANGQRINSAQMLTELTTIAAAATTDTTIQMPAASVVYGVSVRVTTVIPTAATFTVGDSGSAARFSTAAVSTAATSTDPGTKAGAYYNASALSIRITPNLTPADATGRVRVTIYYYTVTPPTS